MDMMAAIEAVANKRDLTHDEMSTVMDLIMTGDTIDAARARELGLINAVVPAEQLLAEVGVLDDLVASGNWKQEAPQGDFLSNALRTGALDVVIVYRSNVEPWQDDVDIIPIDHPRANARQPAAIAANSHQRQLAQRLLDALRSSRSEERFEELGFVWEAESTEIAP